VQRVSPLSVVKPVQVVQPVQRVSPLSVVKPVQSVQPVQIVQPVQKVQPIQVVQPIQQVQPVQEVSPIQSIIPVEPLVPVTPIPWIPVPKSKKLALERSQLLKSRAREFLAQLKVRGRFVTIGKGSRSEAIKLGARGALGSLAATFRVVPSGNVLNVNPSSETAYIPSAKIFRTYKVVKGQKVPLENTWIQRRGQRLVTSQERSSLQGARQRARRSGFL